MAQEQFRSVGGGNDFRTLYQTVRILAPTGPSGGNGMATTRQGRVMAPFYGLGYDQGRRSTPPNATHAPYRQDCCRHC
jgi:hypothetical protein